MEIDFFIRIGITYANRMQRAAKLGLVSTTDDVNDRSTHHATGFQFPLTPFPAVFYLFYATINYCVRRLLSFSIAPTSASGSASIHLFSISCAGPRHCVWVCAAKVSWRNFQWLLLEKYAIMHFSFCEEERGRERGNRIYLELSIHCESMYGWLHHVKWNLWNEDFRFTFLASRCADTNYHLN